MTASPDIKIEIRDLTMAFGSFVVMRDINAQVKRGEVFIIMGGSGCGKSTLLRHMIGLKEPATGEIVACTSQNAGTLLFGSAGTAFDDTIVVCCSDVARVATVAHASCAEAARASAASSSWSEASARST